MGESYRDALHRWKSSGASEDKLRYLRARIRAGAMDLELLEVAVWLGDPEATSGPSATLPSQGKPLLFAPEQMSPAVAESVLEGLPTGPLNTAAATELLERYLRAQGWTQKRACFYAPDQGARVKIKPRSLQIEVGGPGAWQKPPQFAGEVVGLLTIASELVRQAQDVAG